VGVCGIWVASPQVIYAVGRWSGPPILVRSVDGGRTWRSSSLAPLATGLVDVHFFDDRHGLVVGGDGVGPEPAQQESSHTVVLMTDDGGDSWRVVYRGPTAGKWAWKISFPTPQVGYVSTQGPTLDGTVLKTTDGGVTWTALAVGAPEGFSGIGFATTSLGWVASDTTVYETRDGGATWARIALGRSINRFRFLGDTAGYAAGLTVYRWRR
jgi:photosystem II stability/assembly factor-like uncharacterized protein